MSQENVEIVRACYGAFSRREFPADQMAEDLEWTTAPELPDAATYRGVETVRRYFAEWVGGWAEVHNELVDLIDAGDQVVAMVRGRFKLAEDSPAFERDYGHLWVVHDGLVASVRVLSRAEALEAVGLSE